MGKLTPELVEELKSHGLDVVVMGHAYRLNGCVDIFFNGRVLYDKTKNEYLRYTSSERLIQNGIRLADHYGKMDAFKKTDKGRMTYQEYKNRKNSKSGIDMTTAEYYHWKNDKGNSDDYLYFIKSGSNIKIGRSKNPEQRMKSMKTAMADKPKLLLKVKNKGHMERTIHRCFSDWKCTGGKEWFFYNNKIKHFVTWIKSNN